VAWSGNGEIREPQGEALDPAGVGYGDFDMVSLLFFLFNIESEISI
jgi:hypothetical protein